MFASIDNQYRSNLLYKKGVQDFIYNKINLLLLSIYKLSRKKNLKK